MCIMETRPPGRVDGARSRTLGRATRNADGVYTAPADVGGPYRGARDAL